MWYTTLDQSRPRNLHTRVSEVASPAPSRTGSASRCTGSQCEFHQHPLHVKAPVSGRRSALPLNPQQLGGFTRWCFFSVRASGVPVATSVTLNLHQEPMTSDPNYMLMIWQLGPVRKGKDVFVKPSCFASQARALCFLFFVFLFHQRTEKFLRPTQGGAPSQRALSQAQLLTQTSFRKHQVLERNFDEAPHVLS